MAQHDSLYSIIKSLTPNEKKYFKQNAAKLNDAAGKTHYEKLFDALNHWDIEPYNEAAFKKKHKGKSFIKNLAYEKHYLQSLLLKVMRMLHSQSTPQTSFLENIMDYYFLALKGNVHLAQDALNDAKVNAEKAECLEYQLLIEIFELGLYNDTKLDLEVSYNQTKRLIEKLKAEREAFYIASKVLDLSSNRSDKELIKLATTAKKILASESITLKGEKSLTYTMLDYYTQRGQYQEAFEVAKKLVDKMDVSPKSIRYTSTWMLGALYNFLQAASFAEQWVEFKNGLERLKKLEPNYAILAADHFVFVSVNEIKYMVCTNSFENSAQVLKFIEAGLKKYDSNIIKDYRLLLQIHLQYLLFATENYDECLKQIPISQHIAGRDCPNLLMLAEFKILELLCHALTNNYAPLFSQIRSIKRFMKDNKVNDVFFTDIVSLLDEVVKSSGFKSKSVVLGFKKIAISKCSPEFKILQILLTRLLVGEQ
jgi:hypothetical protein